MPREKHCQTYTVSFKKDDPIEASISEYLTVIKEEGTPLNAVAKDCLIKGMIKNNLYWPGFLVVSKKRFKRACDLRQTQNPDNNLTDAKEKLGVYSDLVLSAMQDKGMVELCPNLPFEERIAKKGFRGISWGNGFDFVIIRKDTCQVLYYIRYITRFVPELDSIAFDLFFARPSTETFYQSWKEFKKEPGKKKPVIDNNRPESKQALETKVAVLEADKKLKEDLKLRNVFESDPTV